MKKILFSLALGLSSVSASYAQQANRSGGLGHFTIGTGAFQNQKFYDEVVTPNKSTYEYAKPSMSCITMGAEGYSIIKSVMIGGELSTYAGNKKEISLSKTAAVTDQDKKYTLGYRQAGAMATVNVGYVAFHKQNFIIYPMLGLGYGLSANIFSDSRSGNITDGRKYPIGNNITEKNAAVFNGSLAFNVALGFNYFVKNSNGNAKGFTLGLRAGYYACSPSNKYRANDEKMEEKVGIAYPKTGNNGWYVRLLIGGGKVTKN